MDPLSQLEYMRQDMEAVFGARPGSAGICSVASGTFPPINVEASPNQADVDVFVH